MLILDNLVSEMARVRSGSKPKYLTRICGIGNEKAADGPPHSEKIHTLT